MGLQLQKLPPPPLANSPKRPAEKKIEKEMGGEGEGRLAGFYPKSDPKGTGARSGMTGASQRVPRPLKM